MNSTPMIRNTAVPRVKVSVIVQFVVVNEVNLMLESGHAIKILLYHVLSVVGK